MRIFFKRYFAAVQSRREYMTSCQTCWPSSFSEGESLVMTRVSDPYQESYSISHLRHEGYNYDISESGGKHFDPAGSPFSISNGGGVE
jgi:hypothetical protein